MQARAFLAIREKHPDLLRFADVEAVLSCLADRDAPYEVKDAAFLALLRAHQADRKSGVLPIIARTMLPTLLQEYGKRRIGLSPERADDLAGRLMLGLAEVCARYPVARRLRKVAANIKFDTLRWGREFVTPDLRSLNALKAIRDALAIALAPLPGSRASPIRSETDLRAVLDQSFSEHESDESPEAPFDDDEVPGIVASLEEWVRRRVITGREAELLVKRLLLDRRIEDLAAETREKPATVRRRRKGNSAPPR